MKSGVQETAQHAFASTFKSLSIASSKKSEKGSKGKFYSLPELSKQFPNIQRLPMSLRIVLESVLRNSDGQRVLPEHVEQLANWKPQAERAEEIP
ncbi:MAG: hypothetical protein LBE58_07775, partial [Comamonas sp.]|nr:hypothetical protein [Comamonas sp.]